MYVCDYVNVWKSVYGGGGREGTGMGEAYLVCCVQVGPIVHEHLHHFQITPLSGADESSIIILSATDTHCVRERDLGMDGTTYHSQTHMQRDNMDIQTCKSGLHSASLHVCMYEEHTNIK